MGIVRFLLALDIILTHCGIKNVIGANWAVEVFYLISGFYMTLVLNEKYGNSSNNTRFIKNRIIKLIPTYWLVAILSLFVSIIFSIKSENPIIFTVDKLDTNASFLTWIAATITNIIGYGQDWTLFCAVDPQEGNLYFATHSFAETYPFVRYLLVPQAWFIGLELIFYLLAPFILRKKWYILLPLFILSLFIKIYIKAYLNINDGNWDYRFFPSELMFFIIGYFGYHFYKLYGRFLEIKKYKHLLIIAFVAIISDLWFVGISYSIKYFLFIVLVSVFVPILFANYKSDKRDRFIGDLSYPMYISQSLVIMVLSLFDISSAIIVSVATIGFSYVIYHFVLMKIELYRK